MAKTQTKTVVVYSFPFLFYLFLTFLVLKLTHVIDWSWWWVFAPFWAPYAVFFTIIAAGMIFGLAAVIITLLVDLWQNRKNRNFLKSERERIAAQRGI